MPEPGDSHHPIGTPGGASSTPHGDARRTAADSFTSVATRVPPSSQEQALAPPGKGAGPQTPPTTLGGTFLRIGPGLILAGAIVGSGELIATTKVGAEAGFWLLWLIILGCVLKVFTQVEFGRHTITWGETSLQALDTVPGPRYRVNWLLWYWFAVVVLIISQNGGIVGGVGQALTIIQPLTGEGAQHNALHDALAQARVELALAGGADATVTATIEQLSGQIAALSDPLDVTLWAAVLAVVTSFIMYFGRYQVIQFGATLFVGAFTVVTIVTVFMLQATDWAVGGDEIAQGLSFSLPPVEPASGLNPLGTALAAFGMIGLSAGELIMYPYWCLEKGYARFAGPRDVTPQWTERAKGWMRVMRFDAWFSMGVYTFSTVAFYLLGAAVLGRSGLNPEGSTLIRTLSEMYVPVFGSWAQTVFLIGAIAVLYSTYFVFAAGFSRIGADAFILLGLMRDTDEGRARAIRWTGVALPLLALVAWLFVQAPVAMVLAAGLGQATMMPMLGGAALYFRYKRLDPRVGPGKLWDLFLWASFLGLFLIGSWSLYNAIVP